MSGAGLPRALIILIGAAALVVVVGGYSGNGMVIGPAFMALIIVIAVAPVQGWLRRHGWPGWATTAVVILWCTPSCWGWRWGSSSRWRGWRRRLPQYASKADGLVARSPRSWPRSASALSSCGGGGFAEPGKLAWVLAALLAGGRVGVELRFLISLLLFLGGGVGRCRGPAGLDRGGSSADEGRVGSFRVGDTAVSVGDHGLG